LVPEAGKRNPEAGVRYEGGPVIEMAAGVKRIRKLNFGRAQTRTSERLAG